MGLNISPLLLSPHNSLPARHAFPQSNKRTSNKLRQLFSLLQNNAVVELIRKYLETGSIMNNINVDIVSFYHFTTMSTFLFSSPIMIITAVAMLIYEVGWIGLVAPFLFLIGLGFQRKLMTKGFAYRKYQLFWSDKRSKCVN